MKVLIADDSKVAMLQLRRALEQLGHEVIGHAKTGTEAVSMFDQQRPDIVFLDIVMPELDGIEALQGIRKLDANVPAMIVSSAAAVGDRVKNAAELGAVSVIAKPITVDALKQAFNKLAEGA